MNKVIIPVIAGILILGTLSSASATTPQFLFKFSTTAEVASVPLKAAVNTNGNVYVIDNQGDRVLVYDLAGNFLFLFGSRGSADGQFIDPSNIATGPSGNVYVLDKNNNRVQIFDANGNFLDKFGSFGSGNGQFDFPQGITVDDTEKIYVADTFNNRIQKFDSSGTHLMTIGGTFGSGFGQFKEASSVAIADNGDIFVTDSRNHRVQVFDSNGNFLFTFGSFGTGDGQFGFEVRGIGIDDSGNVYVGDLRNHRYHVFDSTGNFLTKFGSFGTGDGQFNFPLGDPTFDNLGRVFIAEGSNNRVSVFSGLNNPPNCSQASASQDSLWPPNHKFVEIYISGVNDSDGDLITISINSIKQDEPVNEKGSGNTSPDGIINGDTAKIRAERSGSGDGRVYEILFTVDDGNGGACSGLVTVGIPHDKKSIAVDSGVRFDSTS